MPANRGRWTSRNRAPSKGRKRFCRPHGIIRGREEDVTKSPTLISANENGMKLYFVSNEDYKKKESPEFIQNLKEKFGEFYLIPEGGNNYNGVMGCAEILKHVQNDYTHIFCACGTATTYSGIKIAALPHQKVLGISVLKGENKLIEATNNWMKIFKSPLINENKIENLSESTIFNSYHLGGYAAFNEELVTFKKQFEKAHVIPLDYIYTSKLFFAINDLISQSKITKIVKVLVIHSGGLQGNQAFEKRFNISN
jgi:1-aminocyclopropane-1-carboxylate deaminase